MRSYNTYEAKTQLSKLVEQAVNGQAFVVSSRSSCNLRKCNRATSSIIS